MLYQQRASKVNPFCLYLSLVIGVFLCPSDRHEYMYVHNKLQDFGDLSVVVNSLRPQAPPTHAAIGWVGEKVWLNDAVSHRLPPSVFLTAFSSRQMTWWDCSSHHFFFHNSRSTASLNIPHKIWKLINSKPLIPYYHITENGGSLWFITVIQSLPEEAIGSFLSYDWCERKSLAPYRLWFLIVLLLCY